MRNHKNKLQNSLDSYLIWHESFSSRIKFINKAQHPEKNIFVVGEVVSRQQGWIEGALSSVDNIFVV